MKLYVYDLPEDVNMHVTSTGWNEASNIGFEAAFNKLMMDSAQRVDDPAVADFFYI